MILPKVRDPRFVTIRRGGTFTDSDHRLLWTAVAARGGGVAPAAVSAVTDRVFDAFARASLRQIMLVHDVDNPALA